MIEHTIASRYAKAFFDILQQQKSLQEGYEDIQKLISLMRDTTVLHDFLQSPLYPKAVKKEMIKKVVQDKLHQLTLHFLLLIIEKKRSQYLEPIFLDFIELYHKEEKKGTATITLAHPVFSKKLETGLIAFIKKVTGWESVQLSVIVEPTLIGGYILTFKDRIIDASFQTKLSQLQHRWGQSIPLK